ncbi:hypothetical protein Y882_18690 [Dyella japonica DSM 16301]|uniref:Uncharacterized protein n=1 Tax=Dyella japonica DSM 16301 TaxID=1440762 RepID=A0A0G9GWB8_9GAMM|nr:hypothetical protein Y882_18690 [Dyella japonica DSM 16301]
MASKCWNLLKKISVMTHMQSNIRMFKPSCANKKTERCLNSYGKVVGELKKLILLSVNAVSLLSLKQNLH